MSRLGLMAALLTLALAPAGAQAHRAGYKLVGEIAVPLDGREVAIPLPQSADPADFLIQIDGVLHCAIDGRQYGALDELEQDPPGLIRLTPDRLEFGQGYGGGIPGNESVAEFYFPEGKHGRMVPREPLPDAVTAYVDIDELVRRIIVTPTEVKDSLSGELTLRVYRRSSGPLPLLIAAAALVLCTLTVLSLLRRRGRQPSMGDIDRILTQIDEKQAAALKAVDSQRSDAPELESQLKRLGGGAHDLAGHIEAFRASSAQVNREQLASEIADVTGRLEQADRDDLRTELRATLDAKQKVQALLADTDSNEARYVLRLQKIASSLDAVILQMADQDSRLADGQADRKAIDALNAELASLDAAIAELSVLDEAQTIAAR